MPIDPIVLRRRLRVLERCIRVLRQLRALGRQAFVDDEAVQDRAARNAQLAAQACADIALHIVAAAGHPTPETYAAGLTAVATLGVVPANLAERLAGAVRLRNLLVHEYLEVDHGRLFDELGWIEDAVGFAQHVDRWIDAMPA